jgi:hypothetical protein
MIIEALKQNPSLNIIIVEPFINPELNDNFKKLYKLSTKSTQIIILGEFFKDFVVNIPLSPYLDSNGIENE